MNFLKRHMKLFLLGIGALSIGVAWAVTYQAVAENDDPRPTRFQAGIYVGNPDSGVTATSQNRLARVIGYKCDQDFGAIDPGYQITGTPCSVPGVHRGDSCSPPGGLPASPDDGGQSIPDLACVQALAVANGIVKIKMINCASGDAGILNPPDAGFTGFCFSKTF